MSTCNNLISLHSALNTSEPYPVVGQNAHKSQEEITEPFSVSREIQFGFFDKSTNISAKLRIMQ